MVAVRGETKSTRDRGVHRILSLCARPPVLVGRVETTHRRRATGSSALGPGIFGEYPKSLPTLAHAFFYLLFFTFLRDIEWVDLCPPRGADAEREPIVVSRCLPPSTMFPFTVFQTFPIVERGNSFRTGEHCGRERERKEITPYRLIASHVYRMSRKRRADDFAFQMQPRETARESPRVRRIVKSRV